VAGGHEDDHFDGQAFELANSSTLSEKQIVKLVASKEIMKNRAQVKKKIDIAL